MTHCVGTCAFSCSSSGEESPFSYLWRVTALCLGMIALIVGVLILCGVPRLHNFGTTAGWLCVSLGGASMMAALCIKCVKSARSPLTGRELDLKEIAHELCERSHPCSLPRLRGILLELKATNHLHVLNEVPQWYHEQDRLFWRRPKLLTPLHYWAEQGNLEAVKLLIEHGALDFCPDQWGTRSALFVAALQGHMPVVEYLLSKGATADRTFGNVLHSFIPVFVFEINKMSSFDKKWSVELPLACLERILQDMSKNRSANLQMQLKIPVSERAYNCVDWVSFNTAPVDPPLKSLLERFGGKVGMHYSLEQLQSAGWIIGNGCTLNDLEGLK